MSFHCIVLAKQVPDTKNIPDNAMREDGTINRGALPAVFNPEDLNALEMALELKDRYDGRVSVISMGPPAAAQILRDSLYRGADEVVLITDRRFAVADTLATSYTLAAAIRKLAPYDLVLCGRQAIDGDTAQVGPQTADKLDVPQATYVEEVVEAGEGMVEVRKEIEGGHERIRIPMPALLTVTSKANIPRPPSAKRIMRFKRVRSEAEIAGPARGDDEETVARKTAARDALLESLREQGRLVFTWKPEDLMVEDHRIGAAGSPTKVKQVDRVVLQGGAHKLIEPTPEGLKQFVRELIDDHTLG